MPSSQFESWNPEKVVEHKTCFFSTTFWNPYEKTEGGFPGNPGKAEPLVRLTDHHGDLSNQQPTPGAMNSNGLSEPKKTFCWIFSQ